MATRQEFPQSLKSIMVLALACPAPAILLGKLGGQATSLVNPMGIAIRGALKLLPSFIPLVWQVLQNLGFNPEWSSVCPLHILVSFLPLLRLWALAAA